MEQRPLSAACPAADGSIQEIPGSGGTARGLLRCACCCVALLLLLLLLLARSRLLPSARCPRGSCSPVARRPSGGAGAGAGLRAFLFLVQKCQPLQQLVHPFEVWRRGKGGEQAPLEVLQVAAQPRLVQLGSLQVISADDEAEGNANRQPVQPMRHSKAGVGWDAQ